MNPQRLEIHIYRGGLISYLLTVLQLVPSRLSSSTHNKDRRSHGTSKAYALLVAPLTEINKSGLGEGTWFGGELSGAPCSQNVRKKNPQWQEVRNLFQEVTPLKFSPPFVTAWTQMDGPLACLCSITHTQSTHKIPNLAKWESYGTNPPYPFSLLSLAHSSRTDLWHGTLGGSRNRAERLHGSLPWPDERRPTASPLRQLNPWGDPGGDGERRGPVRGPSVVAAGRAYAKQSFTLTASANAPFRSSLPCLSFALLCSEV